MTNPYITDINNVNTTLDKYGVAIIPSLLNTKEITNMQTGMFDFLEHITANFEIPIKKDNPDTYKEFYKLYPMHHMLLQHWQVGHAQFIWDIRQNPKVTEVFAKIWNCNQEDLLCSFDGASFHLSSEITGKGSFTKNWYHTDQSYTHNYLECIQGWVTAYDVNEGDATLAFLEGSHKLHEYFAQEFEITENKDWCPLSKTGLDFYLNNECKEKKIVCPAGSLVLWDSRTIHCGVQHIKNRPKPNFRCVAYICMTPRNWATANILKKKQSALENLRMTNHWPHRPRLFPIHPHTYGEELPIVCNINPPILTDLGKRLAGY